MKNRLLLTCILKDDSEYKLAKRMLESFMPYFDGLCVAISGNPSYKLIKLIKKYQGVYVQMSPDTHPEVYCNGQFANFAAARNVCFSLADTLEGYDWYAWADVDDVLIGGDHLQFVAQEATKSNMDAVFFTYWYSIRPNKDGTYDEKNVDIDHMRERLIKPKMFKWVSRLHEIALPKEDNYKPRLTDYKFDNKRSNNIVWVHLTDKNRADSNSKRNIEILKLQIQDEQGKDPRTLFYLAKTYFDFNDPQYDKDSIDLLEKYLEMSGWREERSSAWEYLGKIYGRQGNHKAAIDCFFEGSKEFGKRHLNYLHISREYFELGLIDESEFWLNVALTMDKPEARTTIGNPLEIMFMAASIKVNIAVKRMQIDEAIKWLKIRNDLGKVEDDGLLKILEDSQYQNQIATAIFNLGKYLKNKGYTGRAKQLLEVIPPEFVGEPFVSYMANELVEPRVWGEKSVVYYASFGGKHFEKWNGDNLKTGIGGSETAVIELSQQWVLQGYEVTVFCDCGEESVVDGVLYRPYWQINLHDQFNILILWRSPHMLDVDWKTKKLFMDLHDVASNLDWSQERVNRIDRVFFKSQYHRSMVPSLPEEKVAVISNGISL